jgi:hypothetical protein
MKICQEVPDFVIRQNIWHFTQRPKYVSLLPGTVKITMQVLSWTEKVSGY